MYTATRRVDKTPYKDPFDGDIFGGNIFGNIFENSIGSNFPPYNIVDIGDNKYTIELAIAGFLKDEISVESENNILTISGKKLKTERKYIHKGIGLRDFVRTFNIASDVVVDTATFESGMLIIDLHRVQPEVKKKSTILIK